MHDRSTNYVGKEDCRGATRIKYDGNIKDSLVEILKFITSFRLSIYSLQPVKYISLKALLLASFSNLHILPVEDHRLITKSLK